MLNIIRKYFIERKRISDVCNAKDYILDMGYFISSNAHKMNNKIILKPSNTEINNLINLCIDKKAQIIRLIKELDNETIETIEIRNITINNLEDCEKAGKLFIRLGISVRFKKIYEFLLEPIKNPLSIESVFGMNLLEGVFLTFLLLILLKIII